MLIHLEAGRCSTSLRELDRLAAECYQSKKYIRPRCIKYLINGDRFNDRANYEYTGYLEDVWECTECDMTFETEHDAKKHTNSPVHDGYFYDCPSCTGSFKVPSALVQHVESHRCSATIQPGTPIAKLLRYIGISI